MTSRYVGKRLLQVVPAVAGIVLIGFLLIHLAPGDPVVALAGESGDAAYYEFMRAKFGLDEPLQVQLVTYAGNVVRGDLGTSYIHGRPALDVILERLGPTLLLTGTALIVSSAAGIVVGVIAARRAGGVLDASMTAAILTVYAAPVFWIGQLALLTLALRTDLFPAQGMTSAGSDATGLAALRDVARHLVLPAAVLASSEIAAVARLTRLGVRDELETDHIRTARAKGVRTQAVLVRHALRRPLLPVVTVIGGRVGHLLAGAVVVEIVFSWPGLGRLLVSSVQARDSPIVLGVFLFVAFGVVLANLATDLLYGWLDPRIRYR
ncbi:MAG TPA: ABC transporter permease [Euzebya sp.]|nr:ABC transporter permease [Euzebya sp.]